MIGRVKGILLEKQSPQLLVDVAGLGYEIAAPMTTIYKLPELGQVVELFTHLVVREDAQLLFGFADKAQRELFRSLIKINGVGPKMALAIMSSFEPAALLQCVNNNDVSTLTKVPGVGKKTAERLLVDLRDRLKDMGLNDSSGLEQGVVLPLGGNQQIADAVSALQALGYKGPEASRSINAIFAEGLSSEELIRQALRGMASS